MRSIATLLSVLLLSSACGGDTTPDGNNDTTADTGVVDDLGQSDMGSDMGPPPCETRLLEPGAEPFERLSDYCFFGLDTASHQPMEGVLPYDVKSTLYADETLKFRFLALPEGTSITYAADDRWEWPVGATLIKTFYYAMDERDPDGERTLLETRLLINQGDEWEAYSYRWNEEQTDAEFTKLGSWVNLDRVDVDGDPIETRYRIPDKNSCSNCHGQDDVTVPLGPRTWQMNKMHTYADGEANQLTRLQELGWLDGFDGDTGAAPSLPDPFSDEGTLETRARSYLESNCAHCHNSEGAGGTSGLNLSWQVTNPRDYGVCKRPVAAGEGSGGFFYDIVPGDSSSSIIIYRMSSEDPGYKMPELPTLTSHDEGVLLISEWIDSMEPAGCPE